jgi:ABC-type glutathione transport system ATPase component
MAGSESKKMTTAHQIATPADQVDHAPKKTAIRASQLWKRYGALEAVRGIELDVGDGEIFGLIGPDGAGKTSTFQILAGVMEPSSGVAEIFGQPARAARSQTGYLTQGFSLYPDWSGIPARACVFANGRELHRPQFLLATWRTWRVRRIDRARHKRGRRHPA